MPWLKRWGMSATLLLLVSSGILGVSSSHARPASVPANQATTKDHSTLVNFNATGNQITRFDSVAAAIDAHDGEIACFNGVFYLYGTSYDCGYEWGNKAAPFCGFKVYTSTDLVNWSDRGFLFDAQTSVWQSRCNGGTYGCYRPHVVFNKKNGLYVLWINVYDNQVGYRVFVSARPTGPFAEIAEPKLAVNSDAPVAGLNNGDHDLFVDDDGTAYIAYTDWRAGGAITVEKLNADYTSGVGEHVQITRGQTEAPALLKRHGKYYILYSDPNCGYCAGTGTSYCSATSPLGPWSSPVKISADSCGGQPSFVSTIKLNTGVIFLYGSDLWNHGAKNEAQANFYWAPLTFAADDSINPIERQNRVSVSLSPDTTPPPAPVDLDSTSGTDGFTSFCDIGGDIQRSQAFTATRTGALNAVSFCTFKSGNPNGSLAIEIYQANAASQPVGKALSSILVLPESIGWAPKLITVHPDIMVQAGARYALVIKSTATSGRYGFEYNDSAPYPGGGEAYSNDGGRNFSAETNRACLFRTFIHSR
ncbi:MAG TPA: family 43 glycosylhydrolase [Verrucomicrobiae bacterium]